MSGKVRTRQELERELSRAQRRIAELEVVRAGEGIPEEIRQLADFLQNTSSGVLIFDSGGRVISSNAAAQELLGLPAEKLDGRDVAALAAFFRRENGAALETGDFPVAQALGRGVAVQNAVLGLVRSLSERGAWVLANAVPACTADGSVSAVKLTLTDISHLKRMEVEREMTIEFLRLINSSHTMGELLRSVAAFFKNCTGCGAVGIRLRQGRDYPYAATLGVLPAFAGRDGTRVCVRRSLEAAGGGDDGGAPDCLCGGLLEGACDISGAALTRHGSFWTNDAEAFLETLPAAAAGRIRMHGCCFAEGPQSLVLIPLGTGGERIGLLQLNSRQKNHFPPEQIALWERLADQLSVALAKFQAEEQLREINDTLEARVRERTLDLRMSNEALRESEERFRLIAAALDETFWITDPQIRRMFYVNPAYERIWGRTRKSLYDEPKSFLDSVHPDDRARVMDVLSLQSVGQPFDHEYRITRPDGSVCWIWDRGFPVAGEGGKVSRYVGVAQDITAWKRVERTLRESEEKYRVLFESARDAIMLLDRNGYFDCNKATLQLFGCPLKRDFVGRHPADFSPPRQPDGRDSREALQAYMDQAHREGLSFFEWQHRRSDGSVFPAEVLLSRYEYQGKEVLQAVVRDVTGRREAALQLQEANAVLEQRTAQLRELAAELTQAEDRERRRLAQILHDELQQLLVGARFGLSVIRQQAQAEAMLREIERVDALLGESVRTSRLLTNELAPPLLYDCGLTEALLWLVGQVREKYGLQVSLDTPGAPVRIERETVRLLLFQAVQELLFNVVKHAEVKNAAVRMDQPDAGHVRVVVTDQGAGFDVRLLSARRSSGGGFGLFSIRERIGLIGGRMDVESAPGKGSRFTLTVPLAEPPAGTAVKR